MNVVFRETTIVESVLRPLSIQITKVSYFEGRSSASETRDLRVFAGHDPICPPSSRMTTIIMPSYSKVTYASAHPPLSAVSWRSAIFLPSDRASDGAKQEISKIFSIYSCKERGPWYSLTLSLSCLKPMLPLWF